MKLSVVIPVYNEKDTVVEIIERTRAVPVDKEIVVVDDGSTDGTKLLLLNRYVDDPVVKLVCHGKNAGKGSAIRTGLEMVSGDIVIVQDADLEYDPQDFIPILKKFEDKDVSVVYGTRFLGMNAAHYLRLWLANKFLGRKNEIKQFHLYFGVQLLNVMANVLYGAGITDEATCYKAFRGQLITGLHLRCRSFEFCPEVTAKVRKAGYRIHEVPIAYHPRSAVEGKKLNAWHGIEAVWTLLKYRFSD